jgi:type VI secretion system Hcp family effector
MALLALMKISGANGESRYPSPYDTWIELQSWDWGVKAETSWTKGGGASVGKPNPGEMNWEHYYDKSSPTILKFICSGAMFDTVEMKMFKTTGASQITQDGTTFFHMIMNGVFITSVDNKASDEGNIVQTVQMVFKDVEIVYRPQDNKKGTLLGAVPFKWDIPGGKVS